MDKYYTMQVCLNGHLITDTFEYGNGQNYCDLCGNKTLTKCQECEFKIKGNSRDDIVYITPPVPVYCENCGSPYPWTEKKKELENAKKKHIPFEYIDLICSRFHSIARQLRKRYNNRNTIDVKDEYDVQDLLHTLLKLYFKDIRPEEWTPSYAGGCSRMDFLLKEEQIVIEVKMTRKNLKDREIGEQLIIDIDKYKVHPDCKTLICFVYDPDGWISNPTGIENDLFTNSDDMKVKVIITPKDHS